MVRGEIETGQNVVIVILGQVEHVEIFPAQPVRKREDIAGGQRKMLHRCAPDGRNEKVGARVGASLPLRVICSFLFALPITWLLMMPSGSTTSNCGDFRVAKMVV